jgi:hypothetical protein
MTFRTPRPTPALVVSLLALFLALGGSSYAAGSILAGFVPAGRLARCQVL